MKKISVFVVVFFALLTLMPAPAAAQTDVKLPNIFTFEEGTTVNYPAGWQAFFGANGYTFIESELTQILISMNPPSVFEEYGVPDGDIQAWLIESFNPILDVQVDTRLIESVQLGDYGAVQYAYSGEDEFGPLEQRVIVTQLNNGIVFYISVINLRGDTITEGETALAILSSFDESNSTYSPETLDLTVPELARSYSFDDATFSFPANWTMEEVDAAAAGYEAGLRSDRSFIVFDLYPADVFTTVGVPEGDLRALFPELFLPVIDGAHTFDPARMVDYPLGDYAAVRYDYLDGAVGDFYERTVVLLQAQNGTVFYLAITPEAGTANIERKIALQILASLSEGDAPPPVEDTGSTGDTPIDSYTFEDGSILAWDTAIWTFSEDENNRYLDSETVSILFFKTFNTIYADNGLQSGDNLGLMKVLYFSFGEVPFDPAAYQDITLGAYPAARYDFIDIGSNGETYDHIEIFVQFPDDSVGFFSIIPRTSSDLSEDEVAAVLAVIETFTPPTQ